jgi:hypothetical protein
VEDATNLADLAEADMSGMGMSKIEQNRLRKAAAAAGLPAVEMER